MKEDKPSLILVNSGALRDILINLKGATPATIETRTVLKMNKKNNPYYESVYKIMRSRVFIGVNYSNSVNNELKRENKEAYFEAKPRVWGKKIHGTPLVLHNDEYYLECQFLGIDPNIEYHYNGEEIDIDIIKDYIPTSKSSSKENQGVDNEVILRVFKLSNIKSMVFNKTKYIVK